MADVTKHRDAGDCGPNIGWHAPDFDFEPNWKCETHDDRCSQCCDRAFAKVQINKDAGNQHDAEKPSIESAHHDFILVFLADALRAEMSCS